MTTLYLALQKRYLVQPNGQYIYAFSVYINIFATDEYRKARMTLLACTTMLSHPRMTPCVVLAHGMWLDIANNHRLACRACVPPI